MIQIGLTEPKKPQPVSELGIIQGNRFRDAYHMALDLADKNPNAQQTAARGIVEEFFNLETTSANAPLDRNSLYFAARPIQVNGVFKFLVPGTVGRELIEGPLFLMRTKIALVKRLVEAKEFERAVAAVEAVRLTLIPERVNGILSFISDAKQLYLKGDPAAAEKAVGTALNHLNRAAAEGLLRINNGAEQGRKANEIVGTQRTIAGLRKKLQSESIRAATVRSRPHSCSTYGLV